MTAPRPCQAELLVSSDPDIRRWWCWECGPNIAGPCGRAGGDRESRLSGLLAEALDFVYEETRDLIESCAILEKGDGIPREGTIDPDEAEELVEPWLDLIRRVEAEGVRPTEEQPAWMLDIVAGRRRL